MASYCCIVGCKNAHQMDSGTLLMKIPFCKGNKRLNSLRQKRRTLWLERINRTDVTEETADLYRVCSLHFVSGRSSNIRDVRDPDWAPSLRLRGRSPRKQTVNVDRNRKLNDRGKISSTKSTWNSLSNKLPSIDSIDVNLDEEDIKEELKSYLTKKGEIFENRTGQLVFICCICDGVLEGLMEVENHLKSHVNDLIIDDEYNSSSVIKYEIDDKTEVFINIEKNYDEFTKQEEETYDIENDSSFKEMEVENNLKSHVNDLIIDDEYHSSSEIKYEIDNKTEVFINIEKNYDHVYSKEEDGIYDIENNGNSREITFSFDDEESLIEYTDDKTPMFSLPNLPVKKTGKYSRRFYPNFSSYLCEVCNRNFLDRSEMRRHINTRHRGLRPHTCNICGRKFAASRNLRVHVQRHNNYKPFACDYCGKAFVTKSELKTHSRTHTGEKNFTCTICGKSYAASGDLSKHTLRVHKKHKRHVCHFNGCNVSYFEKADLSIHIRSHTGERPLNCDICNRTFANPNVLLNHKRLHNPIKRYQCKFCPLKFAQACGRRGHEIRVHGAL